MDTAGLRESLEEAEQLGIRRSREALADASLVLVVLDSSLRPLNEEERRLLAAVLGRPALVALNKSDLKKLNSAADEVAGIPALQTSALTGEGIPEVRSRILAQLHNGQST